MAATEAAQTQTAVPKTPLGFLPISEATNDSLSAVDWGMGGTGKTLFVIRDWPLPILIANLDRPITKSHLGFLPIERRERIFVQNLREDIRDIDSMTAYQIKAAVEADIEQNASMLKGGTFLLDGGTTYREALKLSDPTIGDKVSAGKKWNPKDKAQINAYIAALISWVGDLGINFVVTAHAAWKWEMQTTSNPGEEMRRSLMQTTKLYPKFDDIGFERTSLSLLQLKKCGCGRPIVSDDGSCTDLRCLSQDRKHFTRIVTNKHWSKSEGFEFEDMTYATLHGLCFGSDAMREALMP